MTFRMTNTVCPVCKKNKLEAIEIIRGNVVGYRCHCGADFDAEILHNFSKKIYYWIGKLKNPDYWNLNNADAAEGIMVFKERDEKGIPQYLNKYIIEKIAY